MSSINFNFLGRIGWQEAYDLQEQLLEQRQEGLIPDTVLLLEHDPVFTIGRTPDKTSLRAAESLPFPVIETNRGGQATYHGPGQLVGYLILDLNIIGRDLHAYLRRLEEDLIKLCERFGVKAQSREGLTGVWVGERKLASIGVGVRKWVTMHGFALNVTAESLIGFNPIVPCGIQGVTMSCLADEANRLLSVEAVATEAMSVLAGLGAPLSPASLGEE
ncbi:MAG: lipoate-protein ligase [Verrucomicrobiaceae bacterium]|nr:lipoate-protein ligase [Verrucomicrobiaceae bacterium]